MDSLYEAPLVLLAELKKELEVKWVARLDAIIHAVEKSNDQHFKDLQRLANASPPPLT